VPSNEGSHVLDRLFAFGKQWFVGRENVEHAGPDFQRRIHATGPGLCCGQNTVSADDLVLANLQQQGRNSGVVGVNG
jgi:hypothetical protein